MFSKSKNIEFFWSSNKNSSTYPVHMNVETSPQKWRFSSLQALENKVGLEYNPESPIQKTSDFQFKLQWPNRSTGEKEGAPEEGEKKNKQKKRALKRKRVNWI